MSDAHIPDDDLKALEREVGDLLAEAESLGDQLAAEVGSSSAVPAKKATTAPSNALADDEVTDRLAAVESAIQDAAADLGSERANTAKAKKINLPPKSPPRPRENEQKLATTSAAPLAEPTKPPAPPQVGDARAKQLVTAASKRRPVAGAGNVERLVGARVSQAPVELPARARLFDRVRPMLPVAAMRGACARSMARAVTMLEWLDRPFQRIGYRVRALLGWFALIMFTAAIALYVFVVR